MGAVGYKLRELRGKQLGVRIPNSKKFLLILIVVNVPLLLLATYLESGEEEAW